MPRPDRPVGEERLSVLLADLAKIGRHEDLLAALAGLSDADLVHLSGVAFRVYAAADDQLVMRGTDRALLLRNCADEMKRGTRGDDEFVTPDVGTVTRADVAMVAAVTGGAYRVSETRPEYEPEDGDG